VPGRSAITGSQDDRVWDFLSLSAGEGAENFTKHPHLTLGITAKSVNAVVTVPHAVNATMRRNITNLGEDGFRKLVETIVENLKTLLEEHTGATPWFTGLQRRYPSQRATPIIDAAIEFDLRTALPSRGPTKTQPTWLDAAYRAFVNKEGSNYQIQIGVVFRYDRCAEALGGANAINVIEKVWLACKPLINLSR
jgi:hypothetical protein